MSHLSISPENYSTLLEQKVARCRERFNSLSLPDPQVIASAPEHYRMRAEFRIWHEGDDLYYAMFDPADPKTPLRVDDFPVASLAICELMPRLRDALIAEHSLRHRLFQVEFLSTLSGEMLVTLVYHRRLDDSWQAAAELLSEQLTIQIIGRSRKQKCVLGRDYVNEVLPINGREFHYRQYEGGFTQPNANINCQMIEWALEKLGPSEQDLLELYCGNGNFTAPLSRQFRRVLATEISKTSVKAARENFAANDLEGRFLVGDLFEPLRELVAQEPDMKPDVVYYLPPQEVRPSYVSSAGMSVPDIAVFVPEEAEAGSVLRISLPANRCATLETLDELALRRGEVEIRAFDELDDDDDELEELA